MARNLSCLKLLFLLLFFISCNLPVRDETIAKEITDQNMDRFISNLYGLPVQYYKNGTFPIFLLKKAGENDFFKEQCESILEMGEPNSIENCKKDYFELINKEGFDISENTKYLSFDIRNLSRKPLNKNIQIIENESSIKSNAYVKIKFSNIYIDKTINKAFIVLEETDFTEGRYRGKADIYFFIKRKDEWIFYKSLC